MTPILITAKNGKARPKNPFNPYDPKHAENSDFSRYDHFESTVQWHDCTGCEDGEYLAVLQWQVRRNVKDVWLDIDESDKDYHSEYGRSFQAVWRVVPQPQEKQNEIGNYEIENFRIRLEVNPTPITVATSHKKEEAKTVEVFTANTAFDILKEFDCLSHDGKYIKKNMRCEKVIFAMVRYGEIKEAYSSQQNTALMEENTLKSKALKAIQEQIATTIDAEKCLSRIQLIINSLDPYKD